MLKRIAQTQAVRYRTQGEMQVALGVNFVPDASYNAFLTVPPRLYGESIITTPPRGLAVIPSNTGTGDSAIAFLTQSVQTWFPGVNEWVYRWDSAGGAYIDATLRLFGNVHDRAMFQSVDGTVWMLNLFTFYQLDLSTYEGLDGTDRDYADFGYTSFTSLIVDASANRAVIAGDNRKDIAVHNWQSGAEIRVIKLAAMPVCITPEDSTRCYVLTEDNSLHLINYDVGQVIMSVQLPVESSYVAWDRFRRRLLLLNEQDDAADGACQTTIYGYYPVPVATYLTTPIPLKSARKGKRVPMMVRTVGDLSEPVSGVRVSVSTIGAATLAQVPFGSDPNGDVVFEIQCNDAGSVDVSVGMENGL
jgi:hypothetical protein